MTHKYIAMWSGPRNISTAMMRAWGNRPDTIVCDEPLYAHYLLMTGHANHPGYKETIERHETDWRKVIEWLTKPIADGKSVFYQKHMAHHLLPGMSTDWVDRLTNCFLIREPAETVSSLAEFLPSFTVDETALPQQVALLDRLAQHSGVAPPVIDAHDVLSDPAGVLRQLCEFLDVPFYESMLSWPPGPRDTDGAWAPYWYETVNKTTTFGASRPRPIRVPDHLRPVLDQCQDLYHKLSRYRIRSAKVTSTN